jgi:hypothetical protein
MNRPTKNDLYDFLWIVLCIVVIVAVLAMVRG